MKKIFVLAAIFVLVFGACGDDGSTSGNGDKNNNGNGNNNSATTLKIQNESFSEITEVRWSGIEFTKNAEVLKKGFFATKGVAEGQGYIYFKRSTDPINARTEQLVVVEKGENKLFVITDNTLIVDVDNNNNKGTVGTLGVDPYGIGRTGPGGGMVFFAEGGQYKECSGELGTYNWNDAKTTAQNYKGGGLTDWYLPDRGELELMYRNLHLKGLGGFYNAYYWSSALRTSYYPYCQSFSSGGQYSDYGYSSSFRVRAVRSFSL